MWLLFILPMVKGIIKGTYSESTEVIKMVVTMELSGIPEESFWQSIETPQWRCERPLYSRETPLKWILCRLSFVIEINCLWHPSRYFSNTPFIFWNKHLILYRHVIRNLCVILKTAVYLDVKRLRLEGEGWTEGTWAHNLGTEWDRSE